MSEVDTIRAKALEEIREITSRRAKERERLEHLLEIFTNRLYEGFEEAVQIAIAGGASGIGAPRYLKHPAGGWRRVIQLFIDDWKIVVVPLVGSAWPNINDEAMIPGGAFKDPCARLAFFLMQQDDPQTTSFYDAIILLNSSWFAWGYGWPKQQDNVEQTNFTTLALDLLTSFVKDIHLTWRTRDQTTLADAMDTKRRAYVFGLPGTE
jgi:hypothetical protein